MHENTHVQVPAPRKPAESYGKVDARVMRDPSLPQQVKLVYAVVATYADKHREAYPSRDRLVRETGMGRGTVVAALRCGETAGLFEVRAEYTRDGVRGSTKGDGEQTSNRIALRDFGRGYETGSGPGRTMPSSKRGPSVGRRGVQESDPGGSTVGPKQDHSSETTGSPTTIPRGEHVDASAPSQAPSRSQRQKFRLFKPGDFDTYPPGKAAQYAMRAYARALATVGKVPSDKGRKQVGAWFKTMLEKGQTHERTWELFRQCVDSGVAGGDYSWLVDDPRPAPEPDPYQLVEWTEMQAAVEAWKEREYGEVLTPPELARSQNMYGAEQPIEMIDRTLRKMIRDDSAARHAEREANRRCRVSQVDCDGCEWPAGRHCRDVDGDPMPRTCCVERFVTAGVEPANRAS